MSNKYNLDITLPEKADNRGIKGNGVNESTILQESHENHETGEELKPQLSQILADSHENILPPKKLVVALLGLSLSLFMAFVDQTGITIALPHIADDLDAQDTISWAGTASLISNTVFLVIFGRLSDIFSRKYVLIGSLLLLGVFDLACGLAQTAYQLYIFRAICGIGSGGVTSLTMVIVSDIVTLEDRGKFQGILGSCVGLGNALGPFIASAFLKHSTWRKFYFTLFPLMVSAASIVFWLVPFTIHKSNIKKKLLQIDYLGFFSSSIGLIFLLIPVSGGGTTFQWNSGFSISFLVIGGIGLICFVFIERKVELPLIPVHLFKTRISLTMLLSQNFFFGICYYSTIYYIPFYFQTIRGDNATKASEYMLCLVFPQMMVSLLSGQIISRTKHYIAVVWFGYGTWAIGTCLLLLWSDKSSIARSVIPLIFVGLGVGGIFQPTLVAIQAHSFRKDRSTVISTRNVLRAFGGSIGLAISASILSNIYSKQIRAKGSLYFTPIEIETMAGQIFSSQLLESLSTEKALFIRGLYMEALRKVFYFWIGCIGCCLISTITVRDQGLQPLDYHHDEEKA